MRKRLSKVSGQEDISVPEHLRRMSPVVRPSVEAARRLVMSVAPDAQEIPYRSQPPRSASSMWKIARYAIGGDNVVGIGVFPSHSTIFFYRGRELDDGSGLLKGTGRDARFVRLETPKDAQLPALRKLMRMAFQLALAPKRPKARDANAVP
jgi:hypothetical protein